MAGIGKLGEAGPALHDGMRHQRLEQRADGLRAEKNSLGPAARMQQPVGEDMAAIGIGAELDFIDRDEFDITVQRHGFHRAGEPAGVRRDDLLLAGDQRDLTGALARHHAVVILARQQAEREANDAGGMGEQPLHGQMRLARIGRSKHGADRVVGQA